MNSFCSFAETVTGHNHVKVRKECQDYSSTYEDDLMTVAVIADGHGSDDYPRTAIGSKCAVLVVIEAIKEFVLTVHAEGLKLDRDDESSLNSYMRELESNILKRWHEKIEAHIQANPFNDYELQTVSQKYKERYRTGKHNSKAYGTTVIAVCYTDNFWFGLQIGDGKCIRITKDGCSDEPIPWDDNCHDNITTSLCDDDAINEFRFYFDSNLPAAIFVGTDGIDDSYSSVEELQTVYLSMLSNILIIDKEQFQKELLIYLIQITQKGSGDDVSVAIIINKDLSPHYCELIKALSAAKASEFQLKQITQEFDEAKGLVDYINDSISKTKNSLLNAEERLRKACLTYERKASDKVKAEKRLALDFKSLRMIREQIQRENTNDLNIKKILQVDSTSSSITMMQDTLKTDTLDSYVINEDLER
jgi:serine/threonine protein phosphatase PrpC